MIYNEAASGCNKIDQIKQIGININICSCLIDTTVMIYLTNKTCSLIVLGPNNASEFPNNITEMIRKLLLWQLFFFFFFWWWFFLSVSEVWIYLSIIGMYFCTWKCCSPHFCAPAHPRPADIAQTVAWQFCRQAGIAPEVERWSTHFC